MDQCSATTKGISSCIISGTVILKHTVSCTQIKQNMFENNLYLTFKCPCAAQHNIEVIIIYTHSVEVPGGDLSSHTSLQDEGLADPSRPRSQIYCASRQSVPVTKFRLKQSLKVYVYII